MAGFSKILRKRSNCPHILRAFLEVTQIALLRNSCGKADEYWIYNSGNIPWFQPGLEPPFEYRVDVLPLTEDSWQSPNGVGNPLANWTYMVIAVDETESEIIQSNRLSEWDWEVDI